MQVQSYNEWLLTLKLNNNLPINNDLFEKTFDNEIKEVYEYYEQFVYWFYKYKILNKRSKFTLIEGGKE